MKLVYVCSPVRGNVEENLKKANRYCEYVAGCGHIPVAPHLAWQGFLPETPENRVMALAMGLKLIEYCSEVWCCGDEISQGMQGEIDVAEKLNKPVMYVLQERIDENLKIRQRLESLGVEDCLPDSNRSDYDGKILVFDPQTLITNARNAQNSLWIAYSGFGCTYGARGQAVYAKNLFDGGKHSGSVPTSSASSSRRACRNGWTICRYAVSLLIRSPVKRNRSKTMGWSRERRMVGGTCRLHRCLEVNHNAQIESEYEAEDGYEQ